MADSLYDSLYRNIASMPQGGQGGMPARKAEKPGLLDYVWGVAAGYNPNDIRRGFESRDQAAATQEAMRAQQAQIASGITDPTERALFQTSPKDWAKNVGQQFAPQVIGAGAAQAVAGRRTVEQPSFTESGDTILRRTSEGISPVFTRTTPSIAEQVQQGRLAQDVNQFAQTQNLAERKFQTDTGLAEAELGIKQADLGTRMTEAQLKAAERAKAATGQASAQAQTADSMDQALTRAREYIDTGGVWTGLQPWKRQGRANLEGQIDTLKGNLTFDKLMEMKASSPTGASGLGALSDSEARMLAATVASLSPDMSPAELERSFSVVDGLVRKLRDTSGAADGGQPIRVTSVAQARALPPGTVFIDPNGVRRQVPR